MRQIENRSHDAPALGSKRIKAANKIMYAQQAAKKRDELRARNAYRVAIGLPPAT